MRLTILGCSGSLGAPGNPGSSYLLSTPQSPETPGILLDFGPGALGAMQTVHDPANAHVLFTHLHADHCSDLPSLLVWRRFHPTAPASQRHLMFGPAHVADHFGRFSAEGPDEFDDITDTFEVRTWRAETPVEVEKVTVTPYPALHPAVDAMSLRVEDPETGKVVTFSGDSAMTDTLVDAARDASIFLCEAAWGATSQGKPEGMHLSGEEAGQIARRAGVEKLVIVHIQPWSDPEATLEAARREFDGEIVLGQAGAVFEL